jgi:hypothetical protein
MPNWSGRMNPYVTNDARNMSIAKDDITDHRPGFLRFHSLPRRRPRHQEVAARTPGSVSLHETRGLC